MDIDLSVDISGIRLLTPFLTASGTAGYGEDFLRPPPSSLGGFITKGISLQPRKGNPPPRIVETPCGFLNAIGLENIGLNAFIEKILPVIEEVKLPFIVNIFGESEEEICAVAKRLGDIQRVNALELNVSCPNVKMGGISFGKNKDLLSSLVERIKQVIGDKPLWVKLTPNVTDIGEYAKAVENAGADALTVANSYPALSVNCEKECFELGNVTGGLTGPAIKPLTLNAVWKVVQATSLPVIASGGIFNGNDALEYFLIGAKAVQIGTAALVDPDIFNEIFLYVTNFLAGKGITSLNNWIGRLI